MREAGSAPSTSSRRAACDGSRSTSKRPVARGLALSPQQPVECSRHFAGGTVSTVGGAQHWDTVYGTRRPDEVSWFQERPVTSLQLLTRFADAGGALVDVGAGESFLADELLKLGWRDVTVLDVSAEAVAAVEHRLTGRDGVSFIVTDLLAWSPSRQYDAWHDRAV